MFNRDNVKHTLLSDAIDFWIVYVRMNRSVGQSHSYVELTQEHLKLERVQISTSFTSDNGVTIKKHQLIFLYHTYTHVNVNLFRL